MLLVIFSTQILSFFDSILVAIEGQYRSTAPDLIPLQFQDIPIEENVGPLEAAQKACSAAKKDHPEETKKETKKDY